MCHAANGQGGLGRTENTHEWSACLVFTHFACMYGVVVEIVNTCQGARKMRMGDELGDLMEIA
jgi:hypothetical protein